MIDLTFNGKHHLIDGVNEKLILEMLIEISRLKEEVKRLEKRTPDIKDCHELNVIKINGDFHLVHPDVVSLIDALQAKSDINFKSKLAKNY